MSTTKSLTVRKGLPYQVRARANGKWDLTSNQTFTADGESVSLSMENYDGLSIDYIESYQSADKVDFSNTVLPWKWEYSTALSTNRYCLMPVGTTYENVTKLQWAPSNFTKVGNVNISESKIASNFTSTNYLKLGAVFNPSTYGWLMVFRVKTGSDVSSIHCINGSGVLSGADFQGVCVVTLGNNFVYYLSSTGSSWNIANEVHGATTIQPNTWYYVRIAYTGSLYSLSLSNDGINWTTDASTTSSTPIYVSSQPMLIGGSFYNSSNQSPWNGSIDLSETYMQVAGRTIYMEMTATDKLLNPDIINVGEVSIDSNFVASGFAHYKYLQFQNIFNPGANPWKIVLKVKMDNVTAQTSLLWQSINNANTGRWGLYWYFSEGKLVFIGTSNGSSWDLSIMGDKVYDTNKWYWLKLEYSTTEGYKLSYSEDGSVYTLDNSSVVTTPLYSNLPYMMVGQYNPSNNDLPILGSMDLSETYFEVNGNVVLSGTNHVTETLPGCTYNFTDDGSATTLNCFAVNGDENVVLTPDNSYEEEGTTIDYSDIFSGSVNILGCYAFIFADETFETYDWQWDNQYELVGHPTDNDSTISDFSAGNYAQSLVSFAPNSNKMWEINVTGNIGSVGAKQVIFESDGLQIGITPEGHPYATFTGENGVIGTSTVSSFTVSPNDLFTFVCSYAKFNWESDFHYDMTAYDPDSGNPNEGNQVISTTPIKSSIFKFGLSMREAPSQARLLGTVSISSHTVYEYDNGTWTEAE